MPRRLAPLLLALVLLPGCGDRTPSDEEQVRALLATFAKATEQRDYQTICDDVFSPKLLEGITSIGLPCEVAMRNSLGDVEDPRLTVGRIEIKGDTATAEVRSSAKGQEPSSDTMRLQRIKGAWKVSALGGASAQASPTPSPGP